jgi:hypothetical protein
MCSERCWCRFTDDADVSGMVLCEVSARLGKAELRH